MLREVSKGGSVLFGNFFDNTKAANIITSGHVSINFFFQAVKAYERIMMLDLKSETFKEDRENSWKYFLTHFAILKD
jgi:hypothetical protein